MNVHLSLLFRDFTFINVSYVVDNGKGRNNFFLFLDCINSFLLIRKMENPSTYSDLELFTRELTWDTRTTISKLYSPSFFGALGFGIALATNYFQRRPIMSGNLKNLIF